MLFELEEQDIKQLYIDLERFIENDIATSFSKINFKDYSPIIEELKNKYPQLQFKIESFGISIDKLD